jgi:glutamate racemase
LKVGVFDSGLGGLTVVRSILDTLKGAELFYIADTKHAPYGEKSTEEILQYSLTITDYFIKTHHIDALVIACNTATSAAIAAIRERCPQLIVIGTEPGIKPAIEQTRTGKVGVLATPATLRGEKYQQLVDTHAKTKDIELYEQACPGLVGQIEQGQIDHPKTKAMLEGWLAPMKEAEVDTIVLGCTHYPLAGEMIAHIMEHRLTLIHTGEAIAKRLLSLAQKQGHINSGETTLKLLATGTIDETIVHTILGREIGFEPIVIKSVRQPL